jgi:hypothetical protein
MTAKTDEQQTGFLTALAAPGRSPEIPEPLDVYGWLVGSWELDCLHYRGDAVSLKGEAHFGWTLEGRAVQDVWMIPGHMYGTTLRVWDASIQAWRISWKSPARNYFEEQIGRRVGTEIVQIGMRGNGTPTRWRYTEITPDSFHWLGEALEPDGKTWKLEGEFRARRIG